MLGNRATTGWGTSYSSDVWLVVLVVLLLALQNAQAQQAGFVRELIMPTWIDHGNDSTPLAPGSVIQNNDHIRTGPGARLLLQLQSGAFVRLGENSHLVLLDFNPAQTTTASNTGTLQVVSGTLRYSPTLLSKQRRHELALKFPGLSMALDDADVWGQAEATNVIVGLIKGDLMLRTEAGDAFHLQQPGQFYSVPRSGPATPLDQASSEQLMKWKSQVTIDYEAGTLTGNGLWMLVLKSLEERIQAKHELDALRAAGYPAVLHTVTIKDQRWHRIMIRSFAREAGARKFITEIEGKFGIHNAWPTHY